MHFAIGLDRQCEAEGSECCNRPASEKHCVGGMGLSLEVINAGLTGHETDGDCSLMRAIRRRAKPDM